MPPTAAASCERSAPGAVSAFGPGCPGAGDAGRLVRGRGRRHQGRGRRQGFSTDRPRERCPGRALWHVSGRPTARSRWTNRSKRFVARTQASRSSPRNKHFYASRLFWPLAGNRIRPVVRRATATAGPPRWDMPSSRRVQPWCPSPRTRPECWHYKASPLPTFAFACWSRSPILSGRSVWPSSAGRSCLPILAFPVRQCSM